jgi:hypothetical protein
VRQRGAGLTPARATLALHGPSAAVAELTQALDTPGTVTGDGRLLLEAQLGVFSAYTAADLVRLGPRLLRHRGLAGTTHEERTLLALMSQQALYAGRPAAEVSALAVRALAAGKFFDAGGDRLPWGNAVHALACTDDLDQAVREVSLARDRLRHGSSPLEYAMVCAAATMVAWRAGEVATAEAEAVAGVESLALADPGPTRTGLHAVLARYGARAALERGPPRTRRGADRRLRRGRRSGADPARAPAPDGARGCGARPGGRCDRAPARDGARRDGAERRDRPPSTGLAGPRSSRRAATG